MLHKKTTPETPPEKNINSKEQTLNTNIET